MLDYEKLDVYRVVRLIGALPATELERAKQLVVRMVGMLSRMCC